MANSNENTVTKPASKFDRRILLFVAAVGVVIALPVLLGATTSRYPGRDENRNRIARMGKVERQRLELLSAEFEKLPSSRQEAYRRLHQELQADAQEGGNLNDVLEDYKAWLKSISPWEREELRRKNSPDEKLKFVKEIRSRQQPVDYDPLNQMAAIPRMDLSGGSARGPSGAKESPRGRGREERPNDDPMKPPPEPPPHGHGGRRVSADEFQKMILVLYENLPDDKKKKDKIQFTNDPEELRRCQLRVMSATLAAVDKSRVSLTSWPSEPLYGQLIAQISDPRFREDLADHPHQYGKSLHLRHVLAMGLMDAWKPVVDRLSPDRNTLQELFKSLDETEQQNLTKLDGDEYRRRLFRRYWMNKKGAEVSEVRELQQVIQKLFAGPRGPERPGGPRGMGRDFPPEKGPLGRPRMGPGKGRGFRGGRPGPAGGPPGFEEREDFRPEPRDRNPPPEAPPR